MKLSVKELKITMNNMFIVKNVDNIHEKMGNFRRVRNKKERIKWKCKVYYCPIDATTNHPRIGDFKRHEFIIL